MTGVLASLVWVTLCSAAGMTPTRFHRPIAYTLMAVFPVIGWLLVENVGGWALALFFTVAVFQLRLLLRSWLLKGLRKIRQRNRNG